MKEFYALEVATVCNANKDIAVLPSFFKPLSPSAKLLGKARTLDLIEDDFLSVVALLNEAEEGDVLVINSRQQIKAVAGEFFVTEGQRKKLGGIIINGGFRDSEQTKDSGFPLYYKFLCPMAGTSNTLYPRQTIINIGDITINSGDLLFGDSDGVVLISKEIDLTSLIEKAKLIQSLETNGLAKIKSGVPITKVLNFSEHAENVKKGVESELKFL